MHWIIVPTRNNLQLLKRAIETFRAQDIGNVAILVINNGSTDGTTAWLQTQHDLFQIHVPGTGWSVAHSWNRALDFVFDAEHEDHALVVNNDVELAPWTYRRLLADGGVFVTAVGVRERERLAEEPIHPSRSPHPDFSCYLIRRDCFKVIGPFDENFKVAFCEDWDYHVRMHRYGIDAVSIDLPYLHHASQTVKTASNEDRDRIQAQADLNREYFFEKWGVRGGTDEYDALFERPAPLPKKEQTTSPLNHKETNP